MLGSIPLQLLDFLLLVLVPFVQLIHSAFRTILGCGILHWLTFFMEPIEAIRNLEEIEMMKHVLVPSGSVIEATVDYIRNCGVGLIRTTLTTKRLGLKTFSLVDV